MTKTIAFAQHIRTSSKARRGFRTFKRSISAINEQLDEKLGTYGVYTPTQYLNFQEMEPEEYPKLFMFYRMDGLRVLCKSTYVGEDLHSYPPRAGNYISHALVCGDVERFNPVEIFKNLTIWVDKRSAIEAIDNIANVELDIDELTVHFEQDSKTFTPDFQKLLGKGLGMNAKRQKMFKQVVDAVILRKPVIIVDEKDMLEYWMFSLLHVFPEEFIFKHLNIASFTNSNLLMEVCNVLCFEPENLEKIRRHNDFARWEVIDGSNQHSPSKYADVLVKCIIEKGEKDFTIFRSEVFKEFESTSNFSLEEFNGHAWFFDELDRIEEMSDENFAQLMTICLKKETKIEAIFREIISKDTWSKMLTFWMTLRKDKATNNIENYRFIHDKYYLPEVMGNDWLEFEKIVIKEIDFRQNLNALLNYHRITNIKNASRNTFYYPKVEEALSSIEDPDIEITGIQKVLDEKGLLDEQSKIKLQERLNFAKFRLSVKQVDNYHKIILLYENQNYFKEGSIGLELNRLVRYVSWDIIFKLIGDKKDAVVVFLIDNGQSTILPNKELVRLLCNQTYLERQTETYSLYAKLANHEMTEFLKHSPENLQRVILRQMTIATLADLEQALTTFTGVVDEKLVVGKFLIDMERPNELWQLCSQIIRTSDGIQSVTIYPNILKLGESSKRLIFEKVDDTSSVNIPRDYYRVAELMRKNNLIKRDVPKSHVDYSYDDLRSIGYLSDFKDLRRKLNGRPFTETELRNVVKKPWEYLCWKELCDQLNDAEKLQIPLMINEILDETKRSKDTQRHFIWCNLTCEYILYLIKFGTSDEFKVCIKQISINWDEYDFIARRLTCIMTQDNNKYVYFKNINETNRTFSKCPF